MHVVLPILLAAHGNLPLTRRVDFEVQHYPVLAFRYHSRVFLRQMSILLLRPLQIVQVAGIISEI